MSKIYAKKAPRPDRIPNKILKKLLRKTLVIIALPINAVVRISYFSEVWKKAGVIVHQNRVNKFNTTAGNCSQNHSFRQNKIRNPRTQNATSTKTLISTTARNHSKSHGSGRIRHRRHCNKKKTLSCHIFWYRKDIRKGLASTRYPQDVYTKVQEQVHQTSSQLSEGLKIPR